jgi:outer membrane receptor for ferrienterochelin and colicins
LHAQSTDINGYVMSDDSSSISDATIYINDTIWGISDELGSFTIPSLSPGEYELIVTRLGFSTHKTTISIPLESESELIIFLKQKIYNNNPIVVTANRTSNLLQDVSVPTTVIDKNEIKNSGSLRLSDVLNEQIGLQIVSDHGSGVQIQGFDSEYTLILVDNQPVIGRVAGTLDLSRLAVGNVKQIEIVKGPSSALWGSNALAGVINIITDEGEFPFSLDLNSYLGSNITFNSSINSSYRNDKLKARFFANYNTSDGYDINDETVAPTIPKYDNLTLSSGIRYRLSKLINFGITTKYYLEDQFFIDEINNELSVVPINRKDNQSDYSIAPELRFNFKNRYLLETSYLFSSFESNSSSYFAETKETYFSDNFNQSIKKIETKGSIYWNNHHSSIVGAGFIREHLKAEIYANVPFFDSYFSFGQHKWNFNDRFTIISGFRLDAHSEYNSQLSPKLSFQYRVNKLLKFRGSYGGGFKAPDFRQLFLNFTNPIAGYSVFGTSTVVDGIERLKMNGQITELYFDPNKISEISPERSIAFNIGFDLYHANRMQMSFNIFRNDIRDLIETQRIALKTNGQSVFSYFNLNKVFTQGIETELSFLPDWQVGFKLSIGYQFLDAKKKITRSFDQVIDGELITFVKDDYIPLYNRSKHSFNIKLYHHFKRLNIESTLRFKVRSKYWFFDTNDNDRDESNEYVLKANSFNDIINNTIVNYSLSKNFKDKYQFQIGINNLFNYRNEVVLPSNPGRSFYSQLNIKLFP